MAPRIGCLGGGQLGRMLALAGVPLGLEFLFLDPDPASPAGQVGERLVGPYDDRRMLSALGRGSDLVTFEFESVPEGSLLELEQACPVFPPSLALRVGQDRLLEKELFARLGIAAAPYARVDSEADLEAALAKVGVPARLKSRRLGYDGHGQAQVRSPEELASAFERVGRVKSILEGLIAFERELSCLAVRARSGEVRSYPLVENHHQGGVLRLSLAPAPALTPELERSAEVAIRSVLEELDYTGVLALEMFQLEGRLLGNEIAPRVHNSGHWTIEGAATSQFENHLRAGLGWPLGPTRARGYSAMVNLLGQSCDPGLALGFEGVHLHLYGKAPRPGRKLGHLTVNGEDPARVSRTVQELAQQLGLELPEPRWQGSFWPRGGD